jgi:hypothetical protein
MVEFIGDATRDRKIILIRAVRILNFIPGVSKSMSDSALNLDSN